MTARSLWSRLTAPLLTWLRAVTGRRQLEAEMDAELAAHLELRTADLVRAGLSPEEAARQARVELGTTLTHKERMRAALGLRWIDELAADLRYGLRLLRKSPGFTLIAAVSLALAIGANTTIFSIAKQLLYERLAVPDADKLLLFTWHGDEKRIAVHHIHGDYDPLPGGQVESNVFSYPMYLRLRADNRVLEDLIAFKDTDTSATLSTGAQPVQIEAVSGNFYSALGVTPLLGRPILPADDIPGNAAHVVVLSYGMWERAFGHSADVLGRTVRINNVAMTVIGVNPRDFTGAKSVQQSPDFFVPLAAFPLISLRAGVVATMSNPEQWWLSIMGRRKPGVSVEQAQQAMATELIAVVRATMPIRTSNDLPHLRLVDGSRGLFEQRKLFARPMAVLLAMVAIVLLLACANIANLLLARGSHRQREVSVRLALGAGRLRILRQMLVESLALAALGGLAGLGMGYAGMVLVPRFMENPWEHSEFHIHFDWGVFVFTAAVTLLTGMLAGIAPAVAAARSRTGEHLKENSTTVTRRRRAWAGKSLIGFQIALSMLLLVAAGLFLRTLQGLNSVNLGFRPENLLLAEVDVPTSRYPAGTDVALHRHIEERIAAIPGVDSVSVMADTYISDDRSSTDFLPFGEAFDRNKNQDEFYNLVGDRFFDTLGIPILAGRGFTARDVSNAPKVGVINQALARTRFPGQNPIGKRFTVGLYDFDGHHADMTNAQIEVVGVAGNTRYADLREEPPPQFFLPYRQQQQVGAMSYAIRTRLSPESVLPALRTILREIDPDLPLANVRTQQQQVDAAIQQERMFVVITSGFGLLALALACVGIYGVMAFSVAQRTNEIGIRLALGAQPGRVRGMILRESAILSIAGIVVGAGAALALARLVKSMLYGIAPSDPLTFGAGTLILLVVALAATWIPARRAAGVQPMQALRHE